MKQKTDKTNENDLMTIEEICEKTKISRSTVYQYIRMGLMSPPIKIALKKMRYDQSHIEQIEKISNMRSKNMPLIKIKEVMAPLLPVKTDDDVMMEDLKLQLINQAAQIFSKKGLANTTVGSITKALKIGTGTFYSYFKSKEDLYMEAMKRLPEMIIPKSSWDRIRDEKDYFRKTQQRLLVFLESFPIFNSISNIAKSCLGDDDEMIAKKARACFRTLTRPGAKELRKAIDDGVIREVDIEAAAFLLYGFGEAMGYWLKISPEYTIEDIAEIGLGILRDGLKPRVEANQRKAESAKVTDKKGTSIQLDKILFGDGPAISGRMGIGELRVDINMISAISVRRNEDKTIAIVTTKTGEKINLEVPESLLVSGQTSFGFYQIPLCEIKTIEFGMAKKK